MSGADTLPVMTLTILAAADKFRSTASAEEACTAIAAGAERAGAVADTCPMSDGGEGFAQILGATASPMSATVTGPHGSPVTATWYMRGDGTAIIESASACGLLLAGGRARNDPMTATSYGVGELIQAAIAVGARRAIVGVGGTATTDGGEGAVDALGRAPLPIPVTVAVDVTTTFIEAARLFAPQKGATDAQVDLLTDRLLSLADLYERDLADVRRRLGSGAGGGLAGGLAALGAKLRSGVEVVAEAVDLAARIARADLVVTGEGRLDATSLSGKVVGYLLGHRRAGAPILIVAGQQDHALMIDAPHVQVVSLSDRYGRARARDDVLDLMAAVVDEACRQLLSQDDR